MPVPDPVSPRHVDYTLSLPSLARYAPADFLLEQTGHPQALSTCLLQVLLKMCRIYLRVISAATRVATAWLDSTTTTKQVLV